MTSDLRLLKGGDILSVQVLTDELPGRPFKAWTVLCDFKLDGSLLSNTKESQAHRQAVFAQLVKEETTY